MSIVRVDASTPAVKEANTVASLASNSFSPPAGSVIFLVVGCTSSAQAVSAVTDSLASHLTWTRLNAQTANGCDAEIWYAPCPSAQTNMTVTATYPANGNISIGPIVYTGAATAQTGATVAAGSASGTPSASLNTTSEGSSVLGCVADATNQTAPTVPGGQTTTFNGNSYRTTDTSAHSWWAQAIGSPAGASGNSVTINDTAPTAIAYSMVAVEVLPSAANTFKAEVQNDGTDVATSALPLPAEEQVNAMMANAPPLSGQLWP